MAVGSFTPRSRRGRHPGRVMKRDNRLDRVLVFEMIGCNKGHSPDKRGDVEEQKRAKVRMDGPSTARSRAKAINNFLDFSHCPGSHYHAGSIEQQRHNSSRY